MEATRKLERAPAGIERTRSISLRLKTEERLRLELEAKNNCRTINAMAREAVLAGLDSLKAVEKD